MNVGIMAEKYHNHQMKLHHNFVDFKKAFDRVCREALWLVMKKHNMGEGLVRTIESLYNNSSNTVLTSNNNLNGSRLQLVCNSDVSCPPVFSISS